MKISDGRISILTNEDKVEIMLHDSDASVTFATVEMTPQQFCQALSRLMHTKCKIEVRGLDLVGKKMEVDNLIFPIDGGYRDREAALAAVFKHCPKGWEPDLSFNSQDSFPLKDGQQYAKTAIRRWVDKESEEVAA